MNEDYYIGLDCGTNSAGWAVTDTKYHLMHRRGHDMWGMRLFEEAQPAAERRLFRSNRRRNERAKRRIDWLQEQFQDEINKIDPDFFIRLRESIYTKEDKRGFNDLSKLSKDTLFGNITDHDDGWCARYHNDKEFHQDYPTIWHLRSAIIGAVDDDTKHFDIRLYYLAIEHIIKHRGHFLREGKIESGAGDFGSLWQDFCDRAADCDIYLRDDCADKVKEILSSGKTKTDKKREMQNLIFDIDRNDGEFNDDKDEFNGDKKLLAHLLCGSSVSLMKLFAVEAEADVKLCFDSDSFEDKLIDISTLLAPTDGAEDLIVAAKAIYDYIYLTDLLGGCNFISEAMVRNYDIHKKDLKEIKAALKPFKEDYRHFFKTKVAKNDKDIFYNAYIGKGSTIKNSAYKINQEDINKELEKLFKKHDIGGDLLARAESRILLPKQKGFAKGTIPQQLHHNELEIILAKLAKDYPSFGTVNSNEPEKSNTANKKIEYIHSFRIPYYGGPLNSSSEKENVFTWADKIGQKVYPWNYDKLVSRDELASRFIERMKNSCTYVTGATTLPKNSLRYQKYVLLNELNNLKINGRRITNDVKQAIYNKGYMTGNIGGSTTINKLSKFMKENDIIGADDELSGAIEVKSIPGLPTHDDFYRILGSDFENKYSLDDLEKVVELIAILNNEPAMLERKIKEILHCDDESAHKLSRLKYKGWGKFSREFLCEIKAPVDGIEMSLLEAMWEKPNNLMELLSGDYGFMNRLKEVNKAREKKHDQIIYEDVKDLYCSPAVKRTIWQSIKLVNEIIKIMGYPPKKIFLEVTRGSEKDKSVKLTRRKNLLKTYGKMAKSEEIAKLIGELNNKEDRHLQSMKLYLYFQQMGKCAYCGKPIDIEEINNTKLYDRDHIYPQSKTKDDSITRNMVLVHAEENREKTNIYPIREDIRKRMANTWRYWYHNGLITKEKYDRLTRAYPLTPEELSGFISRQLVETSQSVKAIYELLQQAYPDSKVIMTKAAVVSNIRHYYGYGHKCKDGEDPSEARQPMPEFIKIRSLNDVHHAKDAYLNIVAGNVISGTFTDNPRQWVKKQAKNGYNYTISTHRIFRDGKEYKNKKGELTDKPEVKNWDYGESLKIVSDTMKRNTATWTKMNHRLSSKGGGMMNQQLVRKAPGYIPRKQNKRLSDTSKYGGYNGLHNAYFALIEDANGKRLIVGVPLIYEKHVNKYIQQKCPGATVVIDRMDFMSKLVCNGLPVYLSGMTGSNLTLQPAVQNYLSSEEFYYLKKVDSANNKLAKYKDYKIDPDKDGIKASNNLHLFDTIVAKMEQAYSKMPTFGKKINEIKANKDKFSQLDLEMQCHELIEMLKPMQCNAVKGDLSKFVNRASNVGVCLKPANISSWDSAYFIKESVTGLYSQKINLKTVKPQGRKD